MTHVGPPTPEPSGGPRHGTQTSLKAAATVREKLGEPHDRGAQIWWWLARIAADSGTVYRGGVRKTRPRSNTAWAR